MELSDLLRNVSKNTLSGDWGQSISSEGEMIGLFLFQA